MIRLLVVLLILSFNHLMLGQGLAGVRNLDRAVLVSVGYGPIFSAGDLADRFGNGFALDGGVDYVPQNANWQFGIMAQFGFGSEVREDVLAGIRTDAGFIIGNQRQPAQVELRQRQFFVGPRAGYTLSVGGNQRAGIKVTTGLGYFSSRIRFQPDPAQFVPQIDRPLQAGYDRLTGGPALYQFFGYQQLGADRRLNFYLGAEALVGFTRALRSYDIPLGAPPSDANRTDVVLGLRAGLILPLYLGEGKEIFY